MQTLVWLVRELIQDRCSCLVCLCTGKLMASTDSERGLVLVPCADVGVVQLKWSYTTSSTLPHHILLITISNKLRETNSGADPGVVSEGINSRQGSCSVCLWTGKLMASTDSKRRLVLIPCADASVVQFYRVLHNLIHFASSYSPNHHLQPTQVKQLRCRPCCG